jgi:ABC-type glycerol-3-phosphate transport system substrate-binding protein
MNTEAMKQALQFQLDLMNKWKACPKPGYQLPEGVGFLTGNISMNMGSPSYASQVIQGASRWGVVILPKAPTGKGRPATQAHLVGSRWDRTAARVCVKVLVHRVSRV